MPTPMHDPSSETEELPALEALPVDPNSETEVPEEPEPDPPPTITFVCPCRTRLIAERRQYGKRLKCPTCDARLQLALVYDPPTKRHLIAPFRLER